MNPVVLERNGTWVEGAPVVSSVAAGNPAWGTGFAIERGTALVLGLFEARCAAQGDSAARCAGPPGALPPAAKPSSAAEGAGPLSVAAAAAVAAAVLLA